jgi:hypothetical protein
MEAILKKQGERAAMNELSEISSNGVDMEGIIPSAGGFTSNADGCVH